jgi:hypothetical protein
LRLISRNTVDGALPISAAIARIDRPPANRSAITTRSCSERYRGLRGRGTAIFTGGYWTGSPAELRTVRPYRHRVPVLRLIPTIRHASELLIPCAISRA